MSGLLVIAIDAVTLDSCVQGAPCKIIKHRTSGVVPRELAHALAAVAPLAVFLCCATQARARAPLLSWPDDPCMASALSSRPCNPAIRQPHRQASSLKWTRRPQSTSLDADDDLHVLLWLHVPQVANASNGSNGGSGSGKRSGASRRRKAKMYQALNAMVQSVVCGTGCRWAGLGGCLLMGTCVCSCPLLVANMSSQAMHTTNEGTSTRHVQIDSVCMVCCASTEWLAMAVVAVGYASWL